MLISFWSAFVLDDQPLFWVRTLLFCTKAYCLKPIMATNDLLFWAIFLLTGLRIYTGEYKAQGPTLCPTEGRALRGPRALYSPV